MPFLDVRLEFAESLPPKMKLRWFRGKYLHKRSHGEMAAERRGVPQERGFTDPLAKWLRTSMRSFVHEHLLSEDAAVNMA